MVMQSQRTRRFEYALAALVAVLVIGVLGIVLASDTALVLGVCGNVVMLASAYVGFGTKHDRDVRVAMVEATRPTPPPESP